MQARPQVLQPAVYALDAEVWRYAKVPGWCVLLWVSRNFWSGCCPFCTG